MTTTLTPPKPGFDPYRYPPANYADAARFQRMLAVQANGNSAATESLPESNGKVFPVTTMAMALRLGGWWTAATKATARPQADAIVKPERIADRLGAVFARECLDKGLTTGGVVDFDKAKGSQLVMSPAATLQTWELVKELGLALDSVRRAPPALDMRLVWNATVDSLEELPRNVAKAITTAANTGGEAIVWASRTLGEAITEVVTPVASSVFSSKGLMVGLGLVGLGLLIQSRGQKK